MDEEKQEVSFVIVAEMGYIEADKFLDDLVDFLAARGISEIPVSIPGNILIGGKNG